MVSNAVNQIIKEIPSMTGESGSVKSGLVKYLKGLPIDNAKAPVLNALNDTLSAGVTIKNSYKSWNWERDTIFDNIRSAASKITGMTADKWNPGDVYLMKGNKSAKAITDANGMGTTSINQKIGPINNLFVSDWGGSDASIASVSLKQAKAQAGKGKQYLNKVSYLGSSNISFTKHSGSYASTIDGVINCSMLTGISTEIRGNTK